MGRLYRRGRIWWAAWVDGVGERRRESTQTQDETVARAWLSRAELAALGVPVPTTGPSRSLSRVADDYLDAHKPPVWSQGWHRTVRCWVDLHIVPCLPEAIDATGPLEVDAARSTWLERVQPPTVNRISSVAAALWRWAVQRGLARSNPWTGRHRFPEQKKAPPPLTDADLDLFVALIPNQSVRWAAVIALETGLRVSEVRRIRWGDIRGRELHIVSGYQRGMTKNRRERWLALTGRALEALQQARHALGDDLLASMPRNYRPSLHKAQDAAGVGRWRWHDLRHFALTRAAKYLRRNDLRAMAGWVGDESARYVHEDAAAMGAMVTALDRARVVPGEARKRHIAGRKR